jgi:AcrR family transcriptional regulator
VAGFRKRQNADRKGRILRAAVRRIRVEGCHSLRLKDLAKMAEASAGAFCNYCPTKGDVLIAAVAMEVEDVLEACEGPCPCRDRQLSRSAMGQERPLPCVLSDASTGWRIRKFGPKRSDQIRDVFRLTWIPSSCSRSST